MENILIEKRWFVKFYKIIFKLNIVKKILARNFEERCDFIEQKIIKVFNITRATIVSEDHCTPNTAI